MTLATIEMTPDVPGKPAVASKSANYQDQSDMLVMPAIATLVPHSGTMLLLDRVIFADADSLCAEVRIGPDTLFCQQQGVGAWIGVEYMAQAIAAHAGCQARLDGSQVKIGFLLGTRRYDCPRPYFTIGSLLQVHIRRILQAENGFGAFECRIDDMTIAANATVAAVATITVFQPDNTDEFLQDISL